MILAPDDALQAKSRAQALFAFGRRLPDLVFTTRLNAYCFIEFEHVLDDEFWACLQACAEAHGEDAFFAMCLSPDPLENFGHSGVARFARVDPATAYHAYLDASDDPPVSIRHIGDLVFYFGASLQWGFVADRAAELVVGARLGSGSWPTVPGIRYLSLKSALGVAAGPYRGHLPPDVADAYARNYPMDDHEGTG